MIEVSLHDKEKRVVTHEKLHGCQKYLTATHYGIAGRYPEYIYYLPEEVHERLLREGKLKG